MATWTQNDEDYEHAIDTAFALGWSDIAALRRGLMLADHEPSPGDVAPDGDLAA